MMTETQGQQSHTHTVHVHQTTPKPATNLGAGIRLNVEYFMSIPGIIKIVQLIIGIICMACASPAHFNSTHFFLFVAVTAFIVTLLWSFLYMFSIREILNLPINWILTELLNTVITTGFYFLAFILQLIAWSPVNEYYIFIYHLKGAQIAAGCFGLFNTIAYAAGSYFLYLHHKNAPSATT